MKQQKVRRSGRKWDYPFAVGILLLGCGTDPNEANQPGDDGTSTTDTGGGGGNAQAGGTTGSGSGSGSDLNSSGGSDAVASCGTAPVDLAPTVLRRLSALEYQFTIQDLLGLAEPPSSEGIPTDIERLGFRTFAELQTMSAENLRAYLDKAGSLAKDLFADTDRKATVIGCETSEASCLEDFVTRFGKLAYRRPLETTEVQATVDAATEFGSDADDQFIFAIEALLSSAHFLYRIEVGDEPDGLSTLTSYELASRLSFALWGRGPSEGQLNAAEAGALDTPEGLAETATTMLLDDRTQLFFEAFFRQWLGYQTLRPTTPAQEAVALDMQLESDSLLEEFAWTGENFLGVLTANHTYVSPELAEFYGLQPPDAQGKVEFEAGDPRQGSGLLTHASLLSAKSDGDLIAIRGNWLRKTFLCEELHIPEDLADTIGELLVGLDRVGIVQERNERVACANCHSKLDPIGMGFAMFDRAGVFDPEEDISIFGITPALPDAPEPNTFENVGQLSAQLTVMDEVPVCLTERAYLYMNGREPASIDSCSIERMSSAFVGGGQDFRHLLQSIVDDPTFRLRRPPAATSGGN